LETNAADANVRQSSNYYSLLRPSYGTVQGFRGFSATYLFIARLTIVSVDGQGVEEYANSKEDIGSATVVPALILTLPTPEFPQISTLPHFPVRDTLHEDSNLIPKPSTISAPAGNAAKRGLDGLGVECAQNSGTGDPSGEVGGVVAIAAEDYSSRFYSTMASRARKNVARFLTIGLRRETRVDGSEMGATRAGRYTHADGPFDLGRSRRWFKVLSSTRAGADRGGNRPTTEANETAACSGLAVSSQDSS